MNRELLEKKFPFLVIRNRTGHSQHLQYVEDSLTLKPNAERRVTSRGLLQIPDNTLFELVNPTIIDLHAAGVIELNRVDDITATPEAEADAKEPDKLENKVNEVKAETKGVEGPKDTPTSVAADLKQEPREKQTTSSSVTATSDDRTPVNLAAKVR